MKKEEKETRNFYYRPPALICGIDGVLTADPLIVPPEKNSRKERDKFYKKIDYYDPIDMEIYKTPISFIKALKADGLIPIFISEREDDPEGIIRENTLMLLDSIGILDDGTQLLMRDWNDSRSVPDVKEYLLKEYVEPFFDVIICFEYLEECVNMYQRNGIDVFQIRDARRFRANRFKVVK